MKHTITYFILSGIAIGIPVLAATSFKGPTASPPLDNVPGVIWNTKGTIVTQDAEINIKGNAKVNTVNTAPDIENSVLGINVLQSGKAFRFNVSGPATYEMSNMFGKVKNPLAFTVSGGLKIDSLPIAGGLGIDGRVQANKFCFNPGTSASDCLTTWPVSGEGLFVKKSGDAMSGGLRISTASTTPFSVVKRSDTESIANLFTTFGGSVTGLKIGFMASTIGDGVLVGTESAPGYEAYRGVAAYANQIGVFGKAFNTEYTSIGGTFIGQAFGINATTIKKEIIPGRNEYVGTAVKGSEALIGGDFTGDNYGVVANGSTGGYFTTLTSEPKTWLSRDTYGLMTNGDIATTKNLFADKNFAANNNQLEGCTEITVPDDMWAECGKDLDAVNNRLVSAIKRNSTGGLTVRCCKM